MVCLDLAKTCCRTSKILPDIFVNASNSSAYDAKERIDTQNLINIYSLTYIIFSSAIRPIDLILFFNDFFKCVIEVCPVRIHPVWIFREPVALGNQ